MHARGDRGRTVGVLVMSASVRPVTSATHVETAVHTMSTMPMTSAECMPTSLVASSDGVPGEHRRQDRAGAIPSEVRLRLVRAQSKTLRQPARLSEGAVDVHSHVLHGIDDGARTIADSVKMLHSAARECVEVVVATPHVRSDYPTTAVQMRDALQQVREASAAEGIPVRVFAGGEVAIDMLPHLDDADLHAFALAENPRFLLLEFPYTGWPKRVAPLIANLLAARITPVLAHPERNREVQTHPHRLRRLVEMGALIQLTAASVAGEGTSRAARTSHRLIDARLAHFVASDMHSAEVGASSLSAAAAQIDDPGLARWLMCENGRAVIDGADASSLTAILPRRRRPFRRG